MTMINAELNHRLNYEVGILEHAREEYSDRLERLGDCKDALLHRTKRSNGNHYYYVKKHGKNYRYLGNQNNSTVCRIQEARFLKEAIRRIDHDISLINALQRGFEPYDPARINEALPKVYRCDIYPVSEAYKRRSKEWLAQRLDFQKNFPENYPQHKTQRASDGVMVKTISELVLYERFRDAGFAFIYELPLPMNDYGPPLYPDFTILSPVDMKTEILVEYVGRLDQRGYREEFARKVGRYIASGYIPGVNLFFIFSDNAGHIDSMQITKVIADILGINGSL